jgi:hypothetical protein
MMVFLFSSFLKRGLVFRIREGSIAKKSELYGAGEAACRESVQDSKKTK